MCDNLHNVPENLFDVFNVVRLSYLLLVKKKKQQQPISAYPLPDDKF